MKLFNIESFSIIVLLNINTKVVAQNQNNNDILINDVETIFNNMQKKVQEYLQTFSTNTDVINIASILSVAKLNLTTAIKKYSCMSLTTTKTTVTATSTSTKTVPTLSTRATTKVISFIIRTSTTSSTTTTTTSTRTAANVTTTANLLSFICQSYTGVRLNFTA